jgi:hypothetical protein
VLSLVQSTRSGSPHDTSAKRRKSEAKRTSSFSRRELMSAMGRKQQTLA